MPSLVRKRKEIFVTTDKGGGFSKETKAKNTFSQSLLTWPNWKYRFVRSLRISHKGNEKTQSKFQNSFEDMSKMGIQSLALSTSWALSNSVWEAGCSGTYVSSTHGEELRYKAEVRRPASLGTSSARFCLEKEKRTVVNPGWGVTETALCLLLWS